MIKLITFVLLCTIAGYTDLKKLQIPNWITLPGILLGLIFSIIYKDITLINSITSCAAGVLFFGLIAIIGKTILKKEALGFGDVKLITMIGTFWGIEKMIFIIFYSTLVALLSTIILVILKKQKIHSPIPYGFYISIVSIVYLLKGIRDLLFT